MKKILLLLILSFPFVLQAQNVYSYIEEPICWTINGVDSSLTRIYLVSDRTPDQRLLLYTLNAAFDTVSVTTDSISFGWCDCCGGGGGDLSPWKDAAGNNTNDATVYVQRTGDVSIGVNDNTHTLRMDGDFQFRFPNLTGIFDWRLAFNGWDKTGVLLQDLGEINSFPFIGGNSIGLAANNASIFDRTILGSILWAGTDPLTGNTLSTSAGIIAQADGNWAIGDLSSQINFFITKNLESLPSNVMTLQSDGRVELDEYPNFDDGVPNNLLGFEDTDKDITKHPIDGVSVANALIGVNNNNTGLAFINILDSITALRYDYQLFFTINEALDQYNNLTTNDTIQVVNYNELGDQAGGQYKVVSSLPLGYQNSLPNHELTDGRFLIAIGNIYHIKQFGAISSDSTETANSDYQALKQAGNFLRNSNIFQDSTIKTLNFHHSNNEYYYFDSTNVKINPPAYSPSYVDYEFENSKIEVQAIASQKGLVLFTDPNDTIRRFSALNWDVRSRNLYEDTRPEPILDTLGNPVLTSNIKLFGNASGSQCINCEFSNGYVENINSVVSINDLISSKIEFNVYRKTFENHNLTNPNTVDINNIDSDRSFPNVAGGGSGIVHENYFFSPINVTLSFLKFKGALGLPLRMAGNNDDGINNGNVTIENAVLDSTQYFEMNVSNSFNTKNVTFINPQGSNLFRNSSTTPNIINLDGVKYNAGDKNTSITLIDANSSTKELNLNATNWTVKGDSLKTTFIDADNIQTVNIDGLIYDAGLRRDGLTLFNFIDSENPVENSNINITNSKITLNEFGNGSRIADAEGRGIDTGYGLINFENTSFNLEKDSVISLVIQRDSLITRVNNVTSIGFNNLNLSASESQIDPLRHYYIRQAYYLGNGSLTDSLFSDRWTSFENEVWVQDGDNIYYNNGDVGVNTTTYRAELNVLGRIDLELNNLDGNVFVGRGAGRETATGTFNTALGYEALASITTGVNNLALGRQAARDLTTGSNNIFNGRETASSLTSGSNNTIIGDIAGFNLTTGGSNTFIGLRSGLGIETGDFNTIIGRKGGLPTNIDNAVIIADGNENSVFDYRDSQGIILTGTNTDSVTVTGVVNLEEDLELSDDNSGTITITATDTGSFTFATAKDNNTYHLGTSLSISAGSPTGSELVYTVTKSTTQITITLEESLEAGETVNIDWILIR